jgi:hypothetical protein
MAMAVVCMGVCGRAATAQDTGNTQNSGSGQQSAPAQKPDAGPAQNAAPAQEPAASAKAGIEGKWHFVLETPGGDREADADLAVDPDGKVTGKFGAANVAGKYKDGQLDLDFSFTSDELNETDELKFNGKLDENKDLTGTWEFISYNGTFKATRPKA